MADLLFHGASMAAVRLRDLQIRCDTDLREVAVVHWRGLERELLLSLSLDDPSAPSRIRAIFDARYPPPPDAIPV